MIKPFFFFVLLTSNSFADSAKFAVTLARDAYLKPEAFVKKYEALAQHVHSYKTQHLNFYTLINKENVLFVVFEGSRDIYSWERNLDIGEVGFVHDSERKVHRGFYQEAILARNTLLNKMAFTQKVVVSGHSLGGAVALLFAALLEHDGYDVSLFTFGSPPVGNQAFVSSIEELSHIRYQHFLDIVPQMKKVYIDKLKSLLSELNSHIENTQTLKNILSSISGFSYNYIHHGQQKILHNIQSLKDEDNNTNFAKKVLSQTLMYHSAQTYYKGVYKKEKILFKLIEHFIF